MSRLTKNQFLVLCAVWLSKSTVISVLKRLETGGYIEECASNPHYWLKARRGAPYEITDIGYLRLRRELSMYWEIVVKTRKWLEEIDDTHAPV
jgi:DNA-binding PadR family transcriptional regulator